MAISPATVYVGTDVTGTISVPSATFVATDPNDSGAFLELDSCAGIATIAPSAAHGPSITYTVTFLAGGTCTATVSGAGGSATATILATSFSISVMSKGRKG
jgi:hypothetical protein